MTRPVDQRPLHVLEMGTWLTVGGIGRHILSLRDWLRLRGHKVTLAGSPGPWVNEANEPDYLNLDILSVGHRGGALPWRLLAVVRAALRLRRWLRANPVDVIHAHDSAPALVAALARLGLGIPLVVTYHGSEPERIRGFGRIARMCDLTITPSHRSADDLSRIGRVPADRLKVIGLGVPPAPNIGQGEVAALRHQLLAGGDRLIVTIARLTPQKGIDILIDCAASLLKDHPGWRFVIAGDGPEEAHLKELAARRNLDPGLSFIGRTSAPHALLRAADLFLLTSRWEALPFTIVESFQAGTPTVATACSGVVELIDDQVGRVAPVGDLPAIRAAVEDALADENRRLAMGTAALARAAEDRFDPDWVHPQFEALYLSLSRPEPLPGQLPR